MNHIHQCTLISTAVLAVTSVGLAPQVLAATNAHTGTHVAASTVVSPTDGQRAAEYLKPNTSRAGTPNTCIERNHGDWNACNVDNSGAGNRPYQVTKAPRTPDECIKLNKGDFNACNVGNGGAGNLVVAADERGEI